MSPDRFSSANSRAVGASARRLLFALQVQAKVDIIVRWNEAGC